jgi:hypothetical protein
MLEQELGAVTGVEAPGRVELPTNGLGNRGLQPSLSWLITLRVGLSPERWAESFQMALIWQRIWQQTPLGRSAEGRYRANETGVCLQRATGPAG